MCPRCSAGGRRVRPHLRRARLAVLCVREFRFDCLGISGLQLSGIASGIFPAGNGVPQAAGGIQQWQTWQRSAGINIIKTSVSLDQDKTKPRRMEGEFHSAAEMTGERKGKKQMEFLKKAARGDGERTAEWSDSSVPCPPGCSHLLSAPAPSVHSYKSRGGIWADESCVNTAGEMSTQKGG